MKKLSTALLLVVFFTSCNPARESGDDVKANQETETILEMDRKLLRHVVLIKFKEGTSSSDIAKVENAFGALEDKIPEIRGYEWGTNNSPEGADKGFTHCFLVTFESEEDREVYLPHPDHQAFVEVLSPHMEDVLVVDYWTE